MAFVKNLWYVAAWQTELLQDQPISRTIIGDPIVIYRRSDGSAVAFIDRCPHRFAKLSLGRVEGDNIQCMYHGLTFNSSGTCIHVPGSADKVPDLTLRSFPVVERYGWIWVWMGDVDKADPDLIPEGIEVDSPDYVIRKSAIDYEADYQIINDNLCDLTHLDFVHANTLGAVGDWSSEPARITPIKDGLLIERWVLNHESEPGSGFMVDTFNSYRYTLPGILIMRTDVFPAGSLTPGNTDFSSLTPVHVAYDQQAVTPVMEGRTVYHYASGHAIEFDGPGMIEKWMDLVNAAFAEDREMIEGQQSNINSAPSSESMTFIPQDKAPHWIRRMITKRLREESGSVEEEPRVMASVG